jgi:hypothetical protein
VLVGLAKLLERALVKQLHVDGNGLECVCGHLVRLLLDLRGQLVEARLGPEQAVFQRIVVFERAGLFSVVLLIEQQ